MGIRVRQLLTSQSKSQDTGDQSTIQHRNDDPDNFPRRCYSIERNSGYKSITKQIC